MIKIQTLSRALWKTHGKVSNFAVCGATRLTGKDTTNKEFPVVIVMTIDNIEIKLQMRMRKRVKMMLVSQSNMLRITEHITHLRFSF